MAVTDINPIFHSEEFAALRASLESGWSDALDALKASGVPLNAFDDEIGRADADALIPEPVRNEIIKGLPAASAALTLMRQVRMSAKKERQPVLSALPTAYWVNGDTGLKQTTKAEWESQYLEAEELAVLVPIPDAVIDDSDFDVWGEIRPSIIEALGQKLDEATLFDVDSPPSFPDAVITGAISAGNAVTRGLIGDLAADIGDEDGVMNLVEEDGFAVTGFAARTRLKSALRGLRDENGGLLFQPSLQAGTPARLYDEPIVYPDGNGAWEDRGVDLIAGDWSKAIIGIRQDITFRVFDSGVISDEDGKVILNLMQQDSKVLRVVMRAGFAVANPVTRKNQDAGSRYPFAVLESQGS
ncbi:MAG: phage major capsid protein [Solirubrobacteraceae bacterium]|nr:phage major capsid protein [Solirubrobacteraceae bacterium]